MNFKIRKAEKEDMSQVLNLIKALAVFEKEPDAVEINEPYLLKWVLDLIRHFNDF
jgi:hypothetical protein